MSEINNTLSDVELRQAYMVVSRRKLIEECYNRGVSSIHCTGMDWDSPLGVTTFLSTIDNMSDTNEINKFSELSKKHPFRLWMFDLYCDSIWKYAAFTDIDEFLSWTSNHIMYQIASMKCGKPISKEEVTDFYLDLDEEKFGQVFGKYFTKNNRFVKIFCRMSKSYISHL